MLAVTNQELWTRVGKVLADARITRGFKKHHQYVARHLEPEVATIRRIEAGRPGSVGTLGLYAEKLGLNLPSVLLGILSEAQTVMLPNEIQAVVDALRLDDPTDAMLEGWKASTKTAAVLLLRQAQLRSTRTSSPTPTQNAGSVGGASGRGRRRGTRTK